MKNNFKFIAFIIKTPFSVLKPARKSIQENMEIPTNSTTVRI